VLKTGNAEYEEKRSRFISWVYPITTENEALELIATLKKKYWNARHQCYAYIINGETTIHRFSDAGEPSGTAGLPILETIRKKDLSNVLVVVIRYFGGILLGASGLARAYGKAAAAGLSDAQVIIKKLCLIIVINMDYHIYGKIQNFINTYKLPVIDTRYTDIVETELLVEQEKIELFKKELNDITGGNTEFTIKGKTYADFDENGNYCGRNAT
jgi:uncharacterized YigZ family protein